MIYFILQWNSACSVHCQWFKNQIQQHSHKSIQYNTIQCLIQCIDVDRADWPIAPNIDNCPYHSWWLTLVVDVHKNSVVNNPMSINSSEIETWE